MTREECTNFLEDAKTILDYVINKERTDLKDVNIGIIFCRFRDVHRIIPACIHQRNNKWTIKLNSMCMRYFEGTGLINLIRHELRHLSIIDGKMYLNKHDFGNSRFYTDYSEYDRRVKFTRHKNKPGKIIDPLWVQFRRGEIYNIIHHDINKR